MQGNEDIKIKKKKDTVVAFAKLTIGRWKQIETKNIYNSMRGTKYGLLETHTECKKGNQWERRRMHTDQRKQFPPKESSMI